MSPFRPYAPVAHPLAKAALQTLPHANYSHQQAHVRSAASVDFAASDQELMLRSWRRDGRTIALGAGLGVLVLVLVAAAAALLGAGPGPKPVRDPYVSVSDVLRSMYSPPRFNATWLPGSLLMYVYDDKTPMLLDLEKKLEIPLIMNRSLVQHVAVIQYMVSADTKFLLMIHNLTALSRYEFLARFEILDRDKQVVRTLRGPDGPDLKMVLWAPVGNALVFLQGNDVFYCSSATHPRPVRLSSTGRPGVVYNGQPSWSYEEIFPTRAALWFSANGRRFAFATFDDSEVGEVAIPYYFPHNDLYPHIVTVRYPKPGTPIPKASVHVVNLDTIGNQTSVVPKTLNPPEQLSEGSVILGNVQWITNDTLAVSWANRLQDIIKIASYDIHNGSMLGLVFSWEAQNAWVEPDQKMFFSADGSRAVLVAHSSNNNYPHVLLVRRRSQRNIRDFLTRGSFAALNILAWDESRHSLYFLGSAPNMPSQQHLYRVSDDPKGAPHDPVCVSCTAHFPHTNKCLHASASFSPNFKFYELTCNGPDVPEIAIFDQHENLHMLWEDNEVVRAHISNKVLPVTNTMWIPLPCGQEAQVRLWLPPNYDISKSKYPLLIDVNGPPGRRARITDEFRIDWRMHLAANRSIVYAVIEGRGSRLLGDRMKYATYRRFGTVEVDDQIFVVKELLNRLNYIDAAKIGVWGWSYGGYMSIMMLARDTDNVIRCGVATAPVVSWRHYNALYTERYMHLPTEEDNAAGYKEADISSHVSGLKGKRLLIFHGTFDTTVHYYHSLILVDAMLNSNIKFEFQTYPDESHYLYNVRSQVYRKMENFIENCFSVE